MARLGAGTEKLEAELAARLPELELFRLDADVAGRPGKLAETLTGFAACERGVLLGTQMVAKGHHFEALRSPPSSTPTQGWGFRTSGRRSARFSS